MRDPVITQCSMRHLYNTQPKNEVVIEHAKQFERRRCNHHTLEKPLSTLECLANVVDPKGSRSNKHRYIVASQDQDVQEHMQDIPGVPVIYILRSVMIMKPMSNATLRTREKDEVTKFKMGLKGSRRMAALASQSDSNPIADSHTAPGPEIVSGRSTQPRKKPGKKIKSANPLSAKAPSAAKEIERARSGKEGTGSTRRKRKKPLAGANGVSGDMSTTTAIAKDQSPG
ncbi:MAG: hypothetical protein Q9162_007109 [Coniocarpon cinnabarinum]